MLFFSSRRAARSKVQPTHYPRIPFHLLRSAQLLAAAVVTCVLVFFVDQLHHDGYPIPWTFLLVRASRADCGEEISGATASFTDGALL